VSRAHRRSVDLQQGHKECNQPIRGRGTGAEMSVGILIHWTWFLMEGSAPAWRRSRRHSSWPLKAA
jgi:hypothetical protein